MSDWSNHFVYDYLSLFSPGGHAGVHRKGTKAKKTMSSESLEGLLRHAEALYRDYRLQSVRDWKQESGGLAIGYLPIYVPREMLYAQGALPVGLMGGSDDLEVIRGDSYYQSYICHIPRSTIELGLNGSLDCLDGVIFPAICDVIRNLSGMWKMLFPKKLVRYLDLPQDFDREIGGAFFRRELEDLSADLVAQGARPLEEGALRRSIEAYNDNRRLIRQLAELRRSEPWKVPASELYLLMRAGLVLPVEEHTRMLEAYRQELEGELKWINKQLAALKKDKRS